MNKGPVAGIILAAGMSKRFRKVKQLCKIGNSTILSVVIKAAIKSDLDKIVLVLGHESEKIKASLVNILNDPKLAAVVNSNYSRGMSTSLGCGLMEVRKEFSSVMILMGDQPFVSYKVINHILTAFKSTNKDICVPVHKGKRGLPVCFTDTFYNDMLKISGDMGAREIIRENPSEILTVEIEDPACFMDIDEEADLDRLEFFLKKMEKEE
jgi:molybdenum cofactor cytidylyltransferase